MVPRRPRQFETRRSLVIADGSSDPSAPRRRRPTKAAYRRRRLMVMLVVFAAVLIWIIAPSTPGPTKHQTNDAAPTGTVPTASRQDNSRNQSPSLLSDPSGPGYLQPGSDPSVLPGPIMIADKENDRLLIIDPQGRIRWQFTGP